MDGSAAVSVGNDPTAPGQSAHGHPPGEKNSSKTPMMTGMKGATSVNAASSQHIAVPMSASGVAQMTSGAAMVSALPEGEPNCTRCRTLATQNARLNVSMANFRAMYANLHRDYMQLYMSHNSLADQNTSLMKANALLEEQAKYMKKVTEKEDIVLQALRSFRTQRKLIRKEKGRRDRASQVQKVLASFAEHALPEDIKIRQVDFTVEYKKDNGESVFDIYTLREGKRTKIKNDRERARILGLKEPTPPQLRPPPPLKKLQAPGRLSKDGVEGLSGLPQPALPGQAVNLQLLQAAYDNQCLRNQAAAQQGYMPSYTGYAQAYASGHMPPYSQSYEILPPLPGMPPAQQPSGSTHEALLQMQLANNMQNMQRVGIWSQTGQENSQQ